MAQAPTSTWRASRRSASGRARGSSRTSPKRATRPSPITSCSSTCCSTPGSRASRSRRSTAAPGSRSQHQKVFFDTAEEMGRRVPAGYMVSIGMMARDAARPRLRGCSSCAHLPRMLRGDEEWMQLLSEPSGGSDMAGALTPAHARRRQLHPQRFEDVELGRGTGRLRPVPGAHRLGRAQAPRALHDRGAPEGHARPHHRSASARSPASTATSAPSSSTTSSSRPRTWSARRTRAGRSRSGCSTTSGSPPPAPATATGSDVAGGGEAGFGGRGVRALIDAAASPQRRRRRRRSANRSPTRTSSAPCRATRTSGS